MVIIGEAEIPVQYAPARGYWFCCWQQFLLEFLFVHPEKHPSYLFKTQLA